jgi:hypothetical protein
MTTRRLRFGAIDHNGKSLAFIRALQWAGHELVTEAPADLLLIDADPPPPLGHRAAIARWRGYGAKVALYPHGGGGAGVVLSYDGLWEPDPNVDLMLVTALGHAEVLRRIEHPIPTQTVGWSFCEMRPFAARTDVGHVVFAPTHPNADGSMPDRWREENREVFEALVAGPWRVTVRHIGTPAENGLREADGVTVVNGGRHAELVEIDAADVVVAGEGTFPTLAIARGVPTVIYGQLPDLAIGFPGETPLPLRNRERYAEYALYPFDPANGPLDEVIHAAARSDEPILEWKRRFIGDPLREREVFQVLERVAVHGRPGARLDPTRSFTTVAFAEELVERPELLAEYARTYGPGDDATLIIVAPAADGDALLALAERAVAAAGLADDALPDVLLSPTPWSPEQDRVLADRAGAVLGDWPRIGALGTLPSFGTVARS